MQRCQHRCLVIDLAHVQGYEVLTCFNHALTKVLLLQLHSTIDDNSFRELYTIQLSKSSFGSLVHVGGIGFDALNGLSLQ